MYKLMVGFCQLRPKVPALGLATTLEEGESLKNLKSLLHKLSYFVEWVFEDQPLNKDYRFLDRHPLVSPWPQCQPLGYPHGVLKEVHQILKNPVPTLVSHPFEYTAVVTDGPPYLDQLDDHLNQLAEHLQKYHPEDATEDFRASCQPLLAAFDRTWVLLEKGVIQETRQFHEQVLGGLTHLHQVDQLLSQCEKSKDYQGVLDHERGWTQGWMDLAAQVYPCGRYADGLAKMDGLCIAHAGALLFYKVRIPLDSKHKWLGRAKHLLQVHADLRQFVRLLPKTRTDPELRQNPELTKLIHKFVTTASLLQEACQFVREFPSVCAAKRRHAGPSTLVSPQREPTGDKQTLVC